MKKLFLLLAITTSCNYKRVAPSSDSDEGNHTSSVLPDSSLVQSTSKDTVAIFEHIGSDVFFYKAFNKPTHRVVMIDNVRVGAIETLNCDEADFKGNDRLAAKTSIANA